MMEIIPWIPNLPAGAENTKKVFYPILEVCDAPRSVKILTQFVDKCMERQKRKENVLVSVIQESWHRHTPIQRLVLGTANRSDADFFTPQLLRVISAVPNRTHVMSIPNPDMVDLNLSLLFQTHLDKTDIATTPIKLHVTDDVEDEFFLRAMERWGVPSTAVTLELAFPSNLRNGPTRINGKTEATYYPNTYIAVAKRQAEIDQKVETSGSLRTLHNLLKRPRILESVREDVVMKMNAGVLKIDEIPSRLDVELIRLYPVPKERA